MRRLAGAVPCPGDTSRSARQRYSLAETVSVVCERHGQHHAASPLIEDVDKIGLSVGQGCDFLQLRL